MRGGTAAFVDELVIYTTPAEPVHAPLLLMSDIQVEIGGRKWFHQLRRLFTVRAHSGCAAAFPRHRDR